MKRSVLNILPDRILHTCRRTGVRNACALCALVLGSMLIAIPGRTQDARPTVSATFSTRRQPIYQGERFELVLTIVSRGVELGPQFKMSQIPSEDVLRREQFNEMPGSQRQIEGVKEETRRFKCQAQVRRTGTLTMSPVLEVQVVRRERMLFGSTLVRTPRSVRMNPFTIDCRPLPQDGRPDDFSGAIGQFTLDTSVSPKEVAVGELVTVSTTVKGKGSLDGVTSPTLPSIPGFKQYPLKTLPAAGPLAISTEQIVIPENEQASTIPQVRFSYFDPDTGKYVTHTKGPFSLTFKSADDRVAYQPYRPDDTVGTRPSAQRQANIPQSQSVDYFRTAAFLLVLLSIVTTVAGIGHLATGKRHRKRGFRLILTACLLGVLSVGVRHWGGEDFPGRTLAHAATARLAPGHSALESFELGARTRVKLLETWQGWVKVAEGEKRGWIPLHALGDEDAEP